MFVGFVNLGRKTSFKFPKHKHQLKIKHSVAKSLHYKVEQVDNVQGNNLYLVQVSNMTHEYTLWKNAVFKL